MVSKEHVINFLRLNEVELSETDEVIRGALFAARWHEQDVDIALMLVRDIKVDPTRMLPRAHHLLSVDGAIAPQTLSSLLGIDIALRQEQLRLRKSEHSSSMYAKPSTWISVFVIGLALAVVCGFLYMFILEVGPFYSPV